MKRNTLLKLTIVISSLSVLILVGGCQSTKKESSVKCPTCDQKVVKYHHQRGRTYKKVACPTCKTVTTVDPSTGATTATHACDSCGTLVGECPKCASK